MRMYQVDAFADAVFRGNPAAILVLDEWLPDGVMLSIAEENNLAETAFTRRRADGIWDLRWFTPVHEVAFCGHATLATAHILATERAEAGRLIFDTKVGLLEVVRQETGYQLSIPVFPPEVMTDFPPELDNVFDVKPAALFRNFENIFVELDSEAAVRTFEPNLSLIARLGHVGLVITAEADSDSDADFVSRYFVPGSGIPEDPVTGSTHATLVPYWSQKLARKNLIAYQASRRGGWLQCTLEDERVLLAGTAVTFMKAEIVLPS